MWYPAGGFGHFINSILTLYGQGFVRPNNTEFSFSNDGNSHALELVAPKYYNDPEDYNFSFEQSEIYSVLVDNGNNNETKRFLNYFSNPQVIKVCYTDYSWPIIARTMIEKGMRVGFDQEVNLDSDAWPTTEDWALREKYFLFLRDNHLRSAWRNDSACSNLLVEDLLKYKRFKDRLISFGIVTETFEDFWLEWRKANNKYIDPCETARYVLDNIDKEESLTHISDIWTQAVVYYYIWLTYEFEVPHNDYNNWFTNTKDISIMLNKHGVLVDTN